ncbi:alpha/beta hydrolase [Streptomyces althioticus]|uniref:alpha/beta hydrolase n=1 Tax=Streptomyces althioticus TaxID=83380 RepID=UPI0036794BD2
MRRLVLGVAVVSAWAALVSGSTSAVAGVSSPAASARQTQTGTTPALRWHACGLEGADCTSVPAPLDYEHPEGQKVTLAISRLKATDPSRRIGVLFFNPGGPGNAAGPWIQVLGKDMFPARLRAKFDIIGMDPRGVGDSRPLVRCAEPTSDMDGGRYPRTRAQFDQLLAGNRDLAAGCLSESGPLIRHMDTPTIAKDFDQVRSALGEEKVSLQFLSYGTQYAASYAQQFPHRVRAAVLDGPLDHSMGTESMVADGAAAAQDVFDRFVAWCRSDETCVLHGHDVKAEYNALLDRAPLPAQGSADGVTAEQIGFGVYAQLIRQSSWPQVAQQIADASTDAAAFAAVGAQSAAYRVTTCQDMPSSGIGYREFESLLTTARLQGPDIRGFQETWDVAAGCLGWPIPAGNPWRPYHVAGTPPLLVVSGVHDPATPLAWGKAMTSQIKGSRLLTWDDATGHTAFLNSPKTLEREVDYLISGRTS